MLSRGDCNPFPAGIRHQEALQSSSSASRVTLFVLGKGNYSLRYLMTIGIPLIICLLTSLPLQAAEDPEARARRLINALGCKGCHELEGNGGSLAPALDKIGSRLTKQQIEKHLAAHGSTRQKGFMPSYNTTSKDELQNLSDFLYNLR